MNLAMLKVPPSDCRAVPLILTEWGRLDPESCGRLKGLSLRDDPVARLLADGLRNRLDIREAYQGLELAATSFVGHLTVGPLRITINPKLQGAPLTVLVRYAYGLRNLEVVGESLTPTVVHGLHDILIALLVVEIEDILQRGLLRSYVSVAEKLSSPRGRILIKEIVSRGGITEGRLPCSHFHRHPNWKLNQVLRAGLETAAAMTDDRRLHRRALGLAKLFDEVDREVHVRESDLDEVERGLTRLTSPCAPALTIIRLLLGMYGTSIETLTQRQRTPGFLFDMNSFFQRLLSQFLHENLRDYSVKDEYTTKGLFSYAPDANPKGRSLPRPRPDFALFRSRELIGFMDAKYRDVWDQGYSADWLYQLSVYALASPNQKSLLLYATTSQGARDERIDIRHPMLWQAGVGASVILRPVQLQKLAGLLNPLVTSATNQEERKSFAESLVAF